MTTEPAPWLFLIVCIHCLEGRALLYYGIVCIVCFAQIRLPPPRGLPTGSFPLSESLFLLSFSFLGFMISIANVRESSDVSCNVMITCAPSI